MPPSPTLILYTRPRCHLCDRLEALALPHLRAAGAMLIKRNVDDDPAWEDAFGVRIPVLEYLGRVIIEGRPSAAEVESALTQALGK